MKYFAIGLAVLLIVTGTYAPDSPDSPTYVAGQVYIAESCGHVEELLRIAIKSAIDRAKLVVAEMDFMFEPNVPDVFSPKQDKILKLAESMFGASHAEIGLAEGRTGPAIPNITHLLTSTERISFVSELELSPSPMVNDIWDGEPLDIVIHCNFPARFKQSEENPGIYTAGYHKWTKEEYDRFSASRTIQATTSYVGKDHEGNPINHNFIDLFPWFLEALPIWRVQYLDQMLPKVKYWVLDKNGKFGKKVWLDSTLKLLDSVLFHEFTHTIFCATGLENEIAIDIESIKWPGNGGAYGWFNCLAVQSQKNADNLSAFALCVQLEVLGFTVNMETGRYYPDNVQATATNGELIRKVREGLEEKGPEKPDGYQVISWTEQERGRAEPPPAAGS